MKIKIFNDKSRFYRIHLEMIRAVVNFALGIAANIPITESIPAWKVIMLKLKAKLDRVDDLIQQKSLSLKGYAKMKKDLKASLVQTSNYIMNAVYNYALSTNNSVLAAEMLTNKSDLERLNYEMIVKKMQEAIDKVSPLVPSLTAYEIDMPKITAWQTNVTDLNNVLALVKNYYASRHSINKEIQATMRQSMEILYQECDTFITSFKAGNLKYYNDYFANRKLQPLTQHTKLKVSITNELKEPMFNVQVLQNNTANKAFTDIKGECTVYIKVNEGPDAQPVYTFTIGTGPHAIQSGDIEIKKGHTQSRSFIMAPSGFIIPAPVSENENQPA